MFSGSIVALITPFTNDRVDEHVLRELVRFHATAGTAGILPCGTTGEAATIRDDERELIFATIIDEARGKLPVIAGTGTNDTAKTIELTRRAEKLGADGALVVVPYYNKPPQEGLYRHFRAVAEAVSIPIIIYNVPGRTAVSISPETVGRLARDCPSIVAVKEASGSIAQATRILQETPPDFSLLSGDDAMTLPLFAVGGRGVVSVAANIVPGEMSGLCRAVEDGDWDTARQIHQRLYPLIAMLFIETNPIPVKTACALMGLAPADVRLPLCAMEDANRARLKAMLHEYGLLSKAQGQPARGAGRA